MRFIRCLILALLFPTLSPALAQERDIETVIRDQIAAFQADDVATAFEFASPNIQRMFRTPEAFGQMVERGYPMVWRPADMRFLQQSEGDSAVIQRVELHDQRGQPYQLDYLMIRTEDGWRINGVRMVPAPDVGV